MSITIMLSYITDSEIQGGEMKNILILTIVVAFLSNCFLFAQERYPLRQLTSRPDQVGFFDWSPDAKTIVYSKSTGLWKFSVDGEDPLQIITIQTQHPDWSPDGKYIVFDADKGKTIKITTSNGGVPIRIVPETIPIIRSGYPLWSPDGSMILFQGESLALYLLEVQTGKFSKVIEFEKLIPVPKSWSPDGEKVLISLRDRPNREANLWLISLTGEKKQLTFEGAKGYGNGDISPDGSLIVYSTYNDHKLWIMSSQGGKSLQLTFSQDARDSDPKFSPDGNKVAFTREISGDGNIWTLELNMEDIKKELQIINK